MSATKIAFLDVDHTLTRHATGYFTALEAVRRKLIPLGSLISLPFMAIWYRFGPVRPGGKDLLPSAYSALAGLSVEDLNQLGRITFDRHISRDIFAGAREFVFGLKREGYLVCLATSSIDFIIEPVAKELSADATIANSLEVFGGRTTGAFAGGMSFGSLKRDRCVTFAKDHAANLADCAFCSDSVHDLPLLEQVGHPMAVNPDWRLNRIATKRGWPIVRFT